MKQQFKPHPPARAYDCDVCHDSGVILSVVRDSQHPDATMNGKHITFVPCVKCDGKARLAGEQVEETES